MSPSSERAPGAIRAALLACALALGTLVAPPADAADKARFSRITVDVGPLRAKGLGEFADLVERDLGHALAHEFAGSIVRGIDAPVLVVRVDSVTLSSNLNGGDRRHSGSSGVTDYMEGEGIVVADGRTVTHFPMLGAYDNALGPAVMFPQAMERRIKGLSEFYAGWMRRKVGA